MRKEHQTYIDIVITRELTNGALCISFDQAKCHVDISTSSKPQYKKAEHF